MEHNDALHLISPYLDGELSGPELAALEGHLQLCPDCRGRVNELRALSVLLKASAPEEAPARLKAKVLAEARPAPSLWLKPALTFGLSAACVCLVLVASLKRVLPGLGGPVQGMVSGAAGTLGEDAAGRPAPAAGRLQPAAPPPEPKMKRDESESGGSVGTPAAALMAAPEAARALAGGGAGAGSMGYASREKDLAFRDARLDGLGKTEDRGPAAKRGAASAPASSAFPADDKVEEAREPTGWSGAAVHPPKKLETVVIEDGGSWIRFWPGLAAQPLPLLDFGTERVAGVVAGEREAGVELVSVEADAKGVLVRWKRVPGGPGWELRVLPASELPVRFEEVRPSGSRAPAEVRR